MHIILPKFKYVILALIIVLGVSCSGEDGIDGMDGIDGVQGPAGPAGQDGVDGNANVTTVIVENYNLVAGVNEISVPELTQGIFNSGTVHAYITLDPTIWFSLPLSELQNFGTEADPVLTSVTVVEMYAMEVGKITLFSLIESQVNLKFVLIDGNISSVSPLSAEDFL